MDFNSLPTQQELLAIFTYNPTDGLLRWKTPLSRRVKAGAIAGSITNGYYVVGIRNVCYGCHRIIWRMVTGDEPPHEIDHIDGHRENNRWSNLRLATRSQNAANTGPKKNNTHGFKGVCRNRKKWVARIMVNRRLTRIGQFDTPEEASAAYLKEARKHHGNYVANADNIRTDT